MKLPRPGIVGRISRFLVGGLSLSFVGGYLPYFTFFTTTNPANDNSPYLIGVLIAFMVFNDVINIGFNVSWGRRPQGFFVAVVLIGILLDLMFFGNIWGQPLGVILLLLSSFTHLYLGISHILAAIIGTPGCEMRAIPHLSALVQGREISSVVCPGHWDAVDHWENR